MAPINIAAEDRALVLNDDVQSEIWFFCVPKRQLPLPGKAGGGALLQGRSPAATALPRISPWARLAAPHTSHASRGIAEGDIGPLRMSAGNPNGKTRILLQSGERRREGTAPSVPKDLTKSQKRSSAVQLIRAIQCVQSSAVNGL